MESSRGFFGNGRVGFCQFPKVALPSCDSVSVLGYSSGYALGPSYFPKREESEGWRVALF